MAHAALAALLVVTTLSAVLVTSGVAKLRDLRATRDAFDALRIPALIPADAAATALPWTELALATLLLVSPAVLLTPVAVAVLLLMLTYTWVIARALRFEEPVTCSCFGSIGRHQVDRVTLVRNILLSGLAAATCWFAAAGGSTLQALGALDRDDWWALLASVSAAAVAVLVVGVSQSPGAAAPGTDELHDYDRNPIPYASLTRQDGTTVTLRELAASQPRLLVVLNQSCAPCVRTAAKLDDWAAQLDPVVDVMAVYPDENAAAGATAHAPSLGTWEPELNVRRMFGLSAPAAVLLGADGFLAGGPVLGEDGVAEFVGAVLEELGESQEASS